MPFNVSSQWADFYVEREKVKDDIASADRRVILDVFVAASKQPAPLGFADLPANQSGDAFAVYGVDVMLTDQLQPVLLEVNFAPDCLRACQVSDTYFLSACIGHASWLTCA